MTASFKSTKSNFKALLPHIGGLLAVGCWGLSFVATKVIMAGGVEPSPENITLSPTEAYLYRFILAYFIILAVSHRKMFCNSLRDEVLSLLCGMTSGSIYFIAENTALEMTYTTNVSLLSSTSPLVTVLIVGVLYKSERPGRGIIIGSIIAFLGVTCVILNSAGSIDIRPIGDLLAISTAFSWAFYSLIVKKLNVQYDSLFITRKTFFYGVLTALPFLALEPEVRNPIEVLTHGWPMVDMSLAFLVLGPSALAFYLWTVCIKDLGPIVSNNYMYLQPVVTLVASCLILGESISPFGYVGFALILFGLWFGYFLQDLMAKRYRTSAHY